MADERNTSIPEFEFDLEDVVPVQTTGDDDNPTPPQTPDDTPPNNDDTPPATPPANDDEPPATPSTPATPPATPADDEVPSMPEGADPIAYGVHQAMVERGYIAPIEDFKGTFDEVSEIFDKLPDMLFTNMMNSMPEALRDVINFGYQKGNNLTNEDLTSFFTTHKPTNEIVDIESADGQRAYLLKSLVASGQDKEEAEDLIDLWEDKGKLAERAKARHTADATAKAKASEDAIEAERQAKQARKDAQKQFVTSINDTIKETKWSAAVRKNVYDEIFTGKLNEKTKNISKHPKALIQLANYLRHFDVEKGEIDESKFKAQAFSSSTQEVQNNIRRHFQTTPSASTTPPASTSSSTGAQHKFEFAD